MASWIPCVEYRYGLGVPRRAEPQPSEYARAVSAAIRRMRDDRGESNAEIARRTTLSANYIAERLRDLKSFTLTDIELLGEHFGFDPADFLGAVQVGAARPVRRVGGPVGAAGHHRGTGEPIAAGDDDTQAEAEHENP